MHRNFPLHVSNVHAAVAGVALVFLLSSPDATHATWYDLATGMPVHVTPQGPGNSPGGDSAGSQDVPGGEVRTVHWDKKCRTWRDPRTGEEVHVTPRSPD